MTDEEQTFALAAVKRAVWSQLRLEDTGDVCACCGHPRLAHQAAAPFCRVCDLDWALHETFLRCIHTAELERTTPPPMRCEGFVPREKT